jgi:hypothetical protein
MPVTSHEMRPRQIVGTQAFTEPGRTEAGFFDRLGHHVSIEECLHEGHRLLIVHVPAREPGSVPGPPRTGRSIVRAFSCFTMPSGTKSISVQHSDRAATPQPA